ncbi:MAG: hypothetical protein M1817_002042 [Caeruleum heppii]|nr:MAG: hypothetical protein M1817_002042 [Caeruleum heppii]
MRMRVRTNSGPLLEKLTFEFYDFLVEEPEDILERFIDCIRNLNAVEDCGLFSGQKSSVTSVANTTIARASRLASTTEPIRMKKGTKRKLPEEPARSAAASNHKRHKIAISAPISRSRGTRAKHTANQPPSQKLDVYVCGSGDFGELGLGSRKSLVKYPRLNPLLDARTVGIVQVAVGGMHCVALTHNHDILTWGVNDNGALGRETGWEGPAVRNVDATDDQDDDEEELNPRESTPTAIPKHCFGDSVAGFAQVAATDSASFALTVDGSVYGWGTFLGSAGKMGLTEENALKREDSRFEPKPVLIAQLKNIKHLAAGGNHMLALDHHGDLFAWGCGQQRQLGRRLLGRMERHGLTPSRVGWSRKKFAYIACGAYHSFTKDDQGQIYSWGLNNFGQTGIPCEDAEGESIVEKPTPVTALKDYDLLELAGGTHHSMACTTDGKVLVWGRCDDGQLGLPTRDVDTKELIYDSRGRPRIKPSPVVIPSMYHSDKEIGALLMFGLIDIQASTVAAGADNSLAISNEGALYAWGFSANYRTGLGTEEAVEVATVVKNKALTGKRLTYGGCGGQFSVVAGPALMDEKLVGLPNGA